MISKSNRSLRFILRLGKKGKMDINKIKGKWTLIIFKMSMMPDGDQQEEVIDEYKFKSWKNVTQFKEKYANTHVMFDSEEMNYIRFYITLDIKKK